MADLKNNAEILLDLAIVTVDGDEVSHEAAVEFDAGYDTDDIPTTRSGSEPIVRLVKGRPCTGKFTFLQASQALYVTLMELAAVAPRLPAAPGSQLPTHLVSVRHPSDAAGDWTLWLFACTFTNVVRSVDGVGPADITVNFMAIRDSASGDVSRVGPAT